MSRLITLAEARKHILDALTRLPVETVLLAHATRRVLAEDIIARHDQPAENISAMDGYAVRLQDCDVGNAIRVIGEARAGDAFDRAIGPGEAVRISTGAWLPSGADHILIQEEAECDGDTLVATVAQAANGFIRARGRDFSTGALLLDAGTRLTPAAIALCAAAGRNKVAVYRRPGVAILTNGDELCEPGEALRSGALYDSNGDGLAAQIAVWGGSIGWQGRGGDDAAAMATVLNQAKGHDLLVIAGGASVGPHDIVRTAFTAGGGKEIFSRMAVKPGKPAWFGRFGTMPVIGLPGNPASAFVTAELLVRLAVEHMAGDAVSADLPLQSALASKALPANGPRETFARAIVSDNGKGQRIIAAADDQDSSLLRPLVAANALLHRPAGAAAVATGEYVRYLALG
ncbi:MAG: molybdopterin molybdotransferase MoeA [Pseudomonadota bacterium]